MPAEWEPHQATWIAWPHQRDDWPGKFAPIPWVFAEIVRQLHTSERVGILVHDEPTARNAKRMLKRAGVDLGRVDFVRCPTDRGWLRDSAGLFVKNAVGELALLDWGFNAWAKYDNWTLGRQNARSDRRATQVAIMAAGIRRSARGTGRRRHRRERRRIVADHGGMSAQRRQQRNPGMTRTDYEQVFAEHLGVRKVLWLTAESPATTRTATSMTWPASSARGRS